MNDQAHVRGALEAVLAELTRLGDTTWYYGAVLDVAEPRAVEEDLMKAGRRIAALARQAAELVSAFPR